MEPTATFLQTLWTCRPFRFQALLGPDVSSAAFRSRAVHERGRKSCETGAGREGSPRPALNLAVSLGVLEPYAALYMIPRTAVLGAMV
jgi:hypothetical protein